jgi:HEAT repeat protein
MAKLMETIDVSSRTELELIIGPAGGYECDTTTVQLRLTETADSKRTWDLAQDVLAAARSENVNDKVLDDLIQALTLDPSANVRLRALEALFPHADRATVRAGVLAALPREQNPLVQLELIDFVATSQNHDATPLLEHISTDETANGTVREAAKIALAQL